MARDRDDSWNNAPSWGHIEPEPEDDYSPPVVRRGGRVVSPEEVERECEELRRREWEEGERNPRMRVTASMSADGELVVKHERQTRKSPDDEPAWVLERHGPLEDEQSREGRPGRDEGGRGA